MDFAHRNTYSVFEGLPEKIKRIFINMVQPAISDRYDSFTEVVADISRMGIEKKPKHSSNQHEATSKAGKKAKPYTLHDSWLASRYV